jgi:Domain of unknown function (DUF5911)
MDDVIRSRTGAREGESEPRYRPLRDYAAIGDCHGGALVGRDGGIDWCALRRFDADPVFCRLLDADRGGFWSIRPAGEFRVKRSYLPAGNILSTVFTTADGEVALIDFMPVGRALDAGAHDYARLNAPGWLVRRIEGLKGAVEMVVRYRPARAFARLPTELAVEDGVVHGAGVPSLFTDLDLKPHGDRASGRFTLYAGDYRDLVLAEPGLAPGHPPNERVSELFRITRAFWQEWSAYCRYRGPYRAAVERSALALKLLTYAPSGALVGALTACLPEVQGADPAAGTIASAASGARARRCSCWPRSATRSRPSGSTDISPARRAAACRACRPAIRSSPGRIRPSASSTTSRATPAAGRYGSATAATARLRSASMARRSTLLCSMRAWAAPSASRTAAGSRAAPSWSLISGRRRTWAHGRSGVCRASTSTAS